MLLLLLLLVVVVVVEPKGLLSLSPRGNRGAAPKVEEEGVEATGEVVVVVVVVVIVEGVRPVPKAGVIPAGVALPNKPVAVVANAAMVSCRVRVPRLSVTVVRDGPSCVEV